MNSDLYFYVSIVSHPHFTTKPAKITHLPTPLLPLPVVLGDSNRIAYLLSSWVILDTSPRVAIVVGELQPGADVSQTLAAPPRATQLTIYPPRPRH
jgi:hypothetical protein